MVQDISTAEKLRILKALKEHSDEKKEETEKEFEELKKKEEDKKKEQEDLENQIKELESELNQTERDVLREEQEVKRLRVKKKNIEDDETDDEDKDDEDEETLEEITENSDIDEEAERAAKTQYKISIEKLSSAPNIYNKEGSNTTYDMLREFRNKLSSKEALSYEENKLFYEMKENVDKVDLGRLETADDVLDNIVASKYLLKQINKYKG